ncbi:MAG TPA: hypothetical protein QF644_01705 [Candidatus Poseidoniaceae archaeon]|jgi:hypothetical protein|nr:hypothetical protein [Candidatus Poseidoniaceae archaeon]
MIAMGVVLDTFGLGNLIGFDLVFGISALVGGLLFLLWFFLMMIGGAASDLFDGLFDIQIGDTDLSFKALTFQGLSAFLMMFGLIGLMISEMDAPQALSIIGGLGAGGFSMWVVSKLFDTFKQLEQDQTMNLDNANGSTGTVYLRIPAKGEGQIQITFQGAMRTMDAISIDGVEISTGTLIQVIDNVADTLRVREFKSTDKEE